MAWINTPLATVTKTKKRLLQLLKFSIDSALQKFSIREGDANSLYFKNGKWIIGGEFGHVVGVSNTSPKCPEMVQSWSTGPNTSYGFRLVKGKMRCAVEDQALERSEWLQ